MIFDVVTKVFSAKHSGWNGIMGYIMKITHSLVHGYMIDIGKIVMPLLKASMVEKGIRKKVISYPRFLMICLWHLKASNNSDVALDGVYAQFLKKNTHTTLSSQNLNAHLPLAIT